MISAAPAGEIWFRVKAMDSSGSLLRAALGCADPRRGWEVLSIGCGRRL
jgi:hypothetical protein